MYPQSMFLLRNKKAISIFRMKKAPYLLLCYCLEDPLRINRKCSITKMYLYNFDPLKPHFYIVKLGFTGVYIIFLISAQKHRL